jgi:O-acetyl-ADP-ribose deacetylase (regulator of RNase III)
VIELKQGNILKADTEALVSTVNCVGIAGRGISLQFKKAFPENSRAYEGACRRGELQPGSVLIFETGQITNPRYIINFPTKRHWKGKSRLEDIKSGLISLADEIRKYEIHSIAIPPLGCGLGGLDWKVVRPLIEEALSGLQGVKILLFEPTEKTQFQAATKYSNAPNMTSGRAVLVGLMQRYLAGLMDPFVSLIEVHKLMYFIQDAGEPLKLRFVKGDYGPYAENLRPVLSRIDGHLISGYDGIDDPRKQLSLIPGAVNDVKLFLAEHPETRSRFERVTDLVQGFETPFGLELLSTVHWVATRETADTLKKAERLTYSWNKRKRRFSKEQIKLAWDHLQSKGWLVSDTAEK